MTIGRNCEAGSLRNRRQTSWPSIPGIIRSSRIRFGGSAPTFSIASSPEPAVVTS